MPETIHGEKVDESKWAEAKKRAAEQGHSEEYDYIMGIYKKMVGMKAELKYGDMPDEQFDPEQLAAGILVEREHTDDEGVAKQIAKAHLIEDENYYRKLPQIEQTDVGKPVVGKSYIFSTDMIDYSVVEMKGEKNYYLTGYISTHDVDLFNDLITDRGLKSMLHQLTTKTIKLDYEHEVWKDNQGILPVGKIIQAKLDDKGLWVKAQLNDASPKFENLWKSIKNGFVDAFSIAFIPKETVMRKSNGIDVRLIDDLELLNVAVTSAPVNPNAKMDKVFMKALTEINNKEEILMAKSEKVNPPVPELKPEQKADEPKKKKEEEEDEEKKEEKIEEKCAKTEMKAAEIDLKGMEDRIVTSVTEKILKALDEKLVFKAIPQTAPAPEQKAEDPSKGVLDFIPR